VAWPAVSGCFTCKMLRVIVLAVVVADLFGAISPAASSDTPCAVTKPSGDLRGTPQCPGDYGTGGLLVNLQPEIEFRPNGPGFVLPDGSLAWKFGWCRKARGKLTIQGTRLDASAPPLRAEIAQSSEKPGFSPSHLIFPTEGCWNVIGKLGASTVSFVTHVVDHHKRN